MAAEVEVALFLHGGGVTAEYKAKYRSLSFNLKDANNPDLRRRVLSGEVAAQVRHQPDLKPSGTVCDDDKLMIIRKMGQIS